MNKIGNWIVGDSLSVGRWFTVSLARPALSADLDSKNDREFRRYRIDQDAARDHDSAANQTRNRVHQSKGASASYDRAGSGDRRFDQACEEPGFNEEPEFDYVVKYVHPDTQDRECGRSMLAREYACTQLLDHPYLISYLDAELEADVPFLVSARIHGYSLREYYQGPAKHSVKIPRDEFSPSHVSVAKDGELLPMRSQEIEGSESLPRSAGTNRHAADPRRISFADGLMFFRQVTDAVHALHRQRIRHGDLSPGNILIDQQSGRATVIDLSLSELVRPFQADCNLQGGTPGYIAPECYVHGDPVNVSADVYSLGRTMHEFFLTPLPGGTATFRRPAGGFDRLRRLIDGMTARHPLRRPTLEEVLSELALMEIDGVFQSRRQAA